MDIDIHVVDMTQTTWAPNEERFAAAKVAEALVSKIEAMGLQVRLGGRRRSGPRS